VSAYAKNTKVPISRSRDQITELLRQWQCTGVGWQDDFDAGIAELQFRFLHADKVYGARFRINVDEGQDGRVAHRVLLLWIKASLEAVSAGLVDVEAIFLPWLVHSDGRTHYETMRPVFDGLPVGNLAGLLTQGNGS